MFVAAVISVGVGMREVVGPPADHLSWGVVALLFGGCAGYLATFSHTRWELFGEFSWTRLAGAGAVLIALPAAFPPGWVALGVLAVVVATLNIWEAARVRDAAVSTAAAG